jgi:hypothetical protein
MRMHIRLHVNRRSLSQQLIKSQRSLFYVFALFTSHSFVAGPDCCKKKHINVYGCKGGDHSLLYEALIETVIF